MNIDNLSVGLIVKSYREMCKILDEKVKGGKSKELQLKDWKRYFSWKNEKYKFIITEIYPEPKPKIDGRINNGGNIANTKYEDLMDKIIINLLIDYDGYIEESFSQVMDMIDFFSKKYVDLNKSGYKTFAEINDVGVGVTLTYQQKLNNIVKKCLETSLNRLAKNDVITYEKRIMIMDNKLNKSLADVKMEEKIKETEKKMYVEMDIKHYNRIIMDVNRRFKSKVSNELEIMNYWNVYCFELVDKNTDYVEEDRDELMKRLVTSVVEAVKKQKYKDDAGKTFQPYSYEKYQEQIDKLTRLLWKLPEDYISETETNKEIEYLFGNAEEIKQEQEKDINSNIPF